MDSHCVDGKPYTIRSLYLDDVFNSAYNDKVAGVMARDKYRIRIYRHSDREIFLERKRKIGDLIQKSSVQITRRLCEQIISGDPRGLQTSSNALLQDVYVQMRTRLLRPSSSWITSERPICIPRKTCASPFDLHLRSGLHSTELFRPEIATVSPHDGRVEILEVKFDTYLPDYIRGLMDGIRADRSAVSKYVMCRRFEPLNR